MGQLTQAWEEKRLYGQTGINGARVAQRGRVALPEGCLSYAPKGAHLEIVLVTSNSGRAG